MQLAYPACFMKCIESWTFSGMLLVAGLLPQATIAVAAISVSFNCYGLLYMPFCSFGMAVCTRCARSLACACVPLCRASRAVHPTLSMLHAASAQGICFGVQVSCSVP